MAYAHNYSRWIRDEFAEFLHGNVAEIGAGTGSFAALLQSPAVQRFTAFEPSPSMYAQLRSRFADDARVATLNESLVDAAARYAGSFDAVVYNNVLEHVADDGAELALACSTLKPGGALCVFVPALPWLMSDFDRSIGHHRRYRRGELRDRLTGAGLRIVRLHYIDAPGILPWLVAMCWMGGSLDRRKVALYDRFAVPLVRRLERWVRPPIGRNLLAVAVRK